MLGGAWGGPVALYGGTSATLVCVYSGCLAATVGITDAFVLKTTIGAGTGAITNLGVTAGVKTTLGDRMTWGDGLGSITSGAIAGAGAANGLPFWRSIGWGAFGGSLGSFVKQKTDMMLGDQGSFSWLDFGVDTSIGAFTGGISNKSLDLSIRTITNGRNNWNSIYHATLTRIESQGGLNVSVKTMLKGTGASIVKDGWRTAIGGGIEAVKPECSNGICINPSFPSLRIHYGVPQTVPARPAPVPRQRPNVRPIPGTPSNSGIGEPSTGSK
jgi:hypothetical protein